MKSCSNFNLLCKSRLTLVLLNPYISCLYKQCRSKSEANWSRYALSFSMWIYMNNLDQVIWVAENLKRVWYLNLFSRTRVINLAIKCHLDYIWEARVKGGEEWGSGRCYQSTRKKQPTLSFRLERFELFLICKSPWYFLSSLQSICFSVQEKRFKIDFQEGSLGFSYLWSTGHHYTSYRVLSQWDQGCRRRRSKLLRMHNGHCSLRALCPQVSW